MIDLLGKVLRFRGCKSACLLTHPLPKVTHKAFSSRVLKTLEYKGISPSIEEPQPYTGLVQPDILNGWILDKELI